MFAIEMSIYVTKHLTHQNAPWYILGKVIRFDPYSLIIVQSQKKKMKWAKVIRSPIPAQIGLIFLLEVLKKSKNFLNFLVTDAAWYDLHLNIFHRSRLSSLLILIPKINNKNKQHTYIAIVVPLINNQRFKSVVKPRQVSQPRQPRWNTPERNKKKYRIKKRSIWQTSQLSK